MIDAHEPVSYIRLEIMYTEAKAIGEVLKEDGIPSDDLWVMARGASK